MAPLGGIPSTSSLARARAAWASLGREVRIREAERGRGREAESWSSGMGGLDICCVRFGGIGGFMCVLG